MDFLPAQRCSSAVLAIARCMSVRHKSEFYQYGSMDRARFHHRGYAWLILRCDESYL